MKSMKKMRGSKGWRGLRDLCNYISLKDKVVCEIGSYAGESARIFVEFGKVKTLFCVDPWKEGYDDGDEASFSNMQKVEATFDSVAASYSQIIKIKDFSINAALRFEEESLDCVYIDGDHRKESVLKDLAIWFPKIKKDGILSGHDYSFQGVRAALDELQITPEKVFRDTSWIFRRKYL